MTSIQRYDAWSQEWPFEDEHGDLVTYEDHRKIVEELEAAIKRQASASKKLRSFDLERTQHLEAIDRSEYTAAKTLDSERHANEILTHRIEELEAKLSKSEALLAKAVEEKLDAIDMLDAWFDRRKLAHDAVDQAVVDAASGYLRTSRSGGMPQDESDLVLGCIQDMARLSIFADLFARTTLAELKGKDDE